MNKRKIPMLVVTMFASVGIMSSGAAQAQSSGSANFVDRGNPDNALTGGCIDGTDPLCVATKSGTFVAVSSAGYAAGKNAQAGAGGIAVGDQANANSTGGSSGGGAIAVGTGAQAVANSATAIGTVALAKGNTAIAIGRQSAAVGDFSMALGNVSDAHGKSSIALGHSALAQGDRSIAIGGANPTTSDGVSSGASYDAASQTRAGGTQSVAIGAGAQTSGDNQVAIGAGAIGANNNTNKPAFGATAAPAGGAVSFGSAGKERQLKNVAAGVDSTDAVNVSQLKSVNDGLTASVNNVAQSVTNLSTTVGGQINSINTTLGTATSNITNLQAADKLNVKYMDGTHAAISLDGKGGTKVTNVKAAGLSATSTDAVNGSQLYATNQTVAQQANSITQLGGQLTQNTTDIKNIGMQAAQNTANIGALQQDALQWSSSAGAYDASHGSGSAQKISHIAAGVNGTDAVNVDQLTAAVKSGVGQLDTLAVKYDDSSKRQVSLGAGNGGVPVRLANVAAGNVAAGSTDAVNGSQLHGATDSVAAALGGGAAANADGSITAPKYNIGGGAFNNVGDALGNLDGRVTSNAATLDNHEKRIGNAETNIANNTTAISGLQQGSLQFDPAVGAYNAARNGTATKITNVANGNLATGSTDAVNGGQLFGVKSDLEQQITNVSNVAGEAVKHVVKYDVDANGNRLNSVSFAGGDTASPVVLKNVADGVQNTDAVNVEQLKAVQSSLNQLGSMAVTYDDSTNSVITLRGKSGTRITNVQAGTLGATSTDAVNGSQLYATNQQVAKNTTDITNLQQNVTNVANGKAGLVQQQDTNGAITVGAGTGGTSVNFSGASGDRVLTGVAAGINADDAVNVAQLNAVLSGVQANRAVIKAAADQSVGWIARSDAGAIGSGAWATGKNAVAVGQGSVADRDNSFSVGAKDNERQVTNVAAGTAPTDAVNVQQLNQNIAAANGYTDQRVGQMYNDLNSAKSDMFGGVASAMAVAGLPQPTAPGRSMVTAAVANYHGQQGFAAGYSYVTQSNRWVVKASVTGNTRSDFGAVVGAGYQF